ncbi:MAG: hypothetical protein WDW38_003180 [Sanguina aurantia]
MPVTAPDLGSVAPPDPWWPLDYLDWHGMAKGGLDARGGRTPACNFLTLTGSGCRPSVHKAHACGAEMGIEHPSAPAWSLNPAVPTPAHH